MLFSPIATESKPRTEMLGSLSLFRHSHEEQRDQLRRLRWGGASRVGAVDRRQL